MAGGDRSRSEALARGWPIALVGLVGLAAGVVLGLSWPSGEPSTGLSIEPTPTAASSPSPDAEPDDDPSPVPNLPTTATETTSPPQPDEVPTVTATVGVPTPVPTQTTVPTPTPDSERTPDPAPAALAYAFPVQPPAAASYGRDHHDYPATDVFAECGTTLVAPINGVVDEVTTVDRWDPAVNDPDTRGGLSVAIVGDDGVRHYMSHLATLDPTVTAGARVTGGEQIGTVGRSGNAAPTPCHVHYGLSPPRGPGDTLVRRGVIWPWPYLDAWRDGRLDHSPRAEIDAWAAANPAS